MTTESSLSKQEHIHSWETQTRGTKSRAAAAGPWREGGHGEPWPKGSDRAQATVGGDAHVHRADRGWPRHVETDSHSTAQPLGE